MPFPITDLVILNAGQARRMQGQDKLLQTFDRVSQLDKIVQHFQQQVQQIWVNSPHDATVYQHHYPDIAVFTDDQAGYFGPVMGMLSAWSHVQADYVLFVPADITYIATGILKQLHQQLAQHPDAGVIYVMINQQPLYPFCLMQRRCQHILAEQLALQQYSLQASFSHLHAQTLATTSPYQLHSINSAEELAQYQAQYAAHLTSPSFRKKL